LRHGAVEGTSRKREKAPAVLTGRFGAMDVSVAAAVGGPTVARAVLTE